MMSTLTNQQGDKVTVDIGGFGGDNVTGHVTDSQGASISGAKVTVTNTRTLDQGTEDTNNQSEYDLDVNAKPGDRVFIHVEWTDGAGALHVIRGFVNLPAADDSRADREQASPEEMYKRVDNIERKAHDLLEEGYAVDKAIVQGYSEAYAVFVDYFEAVRCLETDDQKKKELDRTILEELKKVHEKFEKARRSEGIPSPKEQWGILEEMWKLILKLIGKVFLLQRMEMPELPKPKPWGGGGGIA